MNQRIASVLGVGMDELMNWEEGGGIHEEEEDPTHYDSKKRAKKTNEISKHEKNG